MKQPQPVKKQLMHQAVQQVGEIQKLRGQLKYVIDELFKANPKHIIFQHHAAGGGVAVSGDETIGNPKPIDNPESSDIGIAGETREIRHG